MVLLGVSLLFGVSARAGDSVWERTRRIHEVRQRTAWQAARRTLDGNSDELDLLRVRAALVDLSRGAAFDPRGVLTLLELRRELGLPPMQNSQEALAGVLSGPLHSYDRAWAHLLSAQLLLQRSEEPSVRVHDELRAAHHADRALLFAWERELRARVLLVRGLIAILRGAPEAAARQALDALRLATQREQRIQAQALLAWSHAALGQERLARQAAVSFHEIEAQRREASGRDALSELPLWEVEGAVLRRALRWLAAAAATGLDASEAEKCRDATREERLEVRAPLDYVQRALLAQACGTRAADRSSVPQPLLGQ